MRISIQLEPMRAYFSIAGRIISTPMIPPTGTGELSFTLHWLWQLENMHSPNKSQRHLPGSPCTGFWEEWVVAVKYIT